MYWQRNTDREWLDRIELEHDNFRTALDHAIATGDAERELRLANALRYFWRVRGYVVEGRRRLEAAVERSDSVEPSSARARSAKRGSWRSRAVTTSAAGSSGSRPCP